MLSHQTQIGVESKIEACPVNAGLSMASICNIFGRKPWLQSIQNHARSRFQAFKHRHLKCLCRLIGIWLIWADALFSDRSSISICCFAQDSIRNMLICSYALFSLIDMNDRTIERSDERGFGWWQVLANSIKISFHVKTNSSSQPEIYKAWKPFWLSN